ncbi:T9SS type A sorting domain-containing protein [Winogradskyella algicola]|uniref:T9SS type A sorting domain-containing protein n=1 Tax=Winogradskyella algicola TaxID=2575815 RepID=UPI001109C2F1
MSVFDLSGRRVLKITNNKRRIDVNDLSNGIYILSLTDTSGKTVNTKFIKTE